MFDHLSTGRVDPSDHPAVVGVRSHASRSQSQLHGQEFEAFTANAWSHRFLSIFVAKVEECVDVDLFWLFLMNALWAVGYPVTAIALHSGASPSLLSAIRLVVAFLLLSPLLLHLKRWSWSLLGLAAFMGIIGFAVPVWLQIIGLRSTNPAIASISVAVEPLLTILLAALFRKAHLSWRHQIALILALGGSWILLGEPRPGHAGHLGGDLALFLAIFCFALYNIVSPALANRVDPAPGSALVFGFGALGSTVLWMLQGSSLPAHLTTTFVWSSGFLAIGATGLAYLLWLWVVNRQSLTVVSLFLYTQPLLGSLLSWMLGQSPLTLSLVSGGLLILLAMTLSQMDILPTAKAN